MSRPTAQQLAASGLEDGHQTALFAELATGIANGSLNPKLRLAYAIPNGGKRGDSERSRMIAGGKLKATGVKAGVPDIHLPVACRGYHSLYIELKRPKSDRGRAGTVQEVQNQWHKDLREEGHYVVTCYGWEPALKILCDYLAQ